MRAFQRIRSDDKTAEKTRRALAVALALIDERAPAPAAPAAATRPPARRARAKDLRRGRSKYGAAAAGCSSRAPGG